MNELNVHELLVLHLNVDRKLGDEIKHHNFIIEHRIDVMTIIEKLESKNYIYKSNAPEVSLNYLKVPDLKDILRDNSLKLSGKKSELIDRIINSLDYDSLNKINLPFIYTATALGNKTIEDTEYIEHFYPHHSISIVDAYNVVQDADKNVDKIDFIYNYYIYQKITNSEFDSAGYYAERLSRYYLIEYPNEIKQRIYVNLSIYLIGMHEMYLYDKLYNMSYDISKNYHFQFHDAKSYYEKPLLVDKVNKNELIENYINDIKFFIDPNVFLATKFILILFAKIENNQSEIEQQTKSIVDNSNNDSTIKSGVPKQKQTQIETDNTQNTSGCLIFLLLPLLPLINIFI